jgi:molybdenum cofactor biosynthesis enzyme MoaA
MQEMRYVVHYIGQTPELYNGKTYWNASVVAFDGLTFVISHRAILTLVTTTGCNAACHFCSNEITFTPNGPYLKYDERVARVKDLALLSGISKVAFTGGEPTASPGKLYDLVRHVSPGFKKARLHTNGYGLFHEVDTSHGNHPLLDALIDAGLTGASISVAHFDSAINAKIMRFKTRWKGLDDDMLRRIASRRNHSFSPRLSCVLTAEGVYDVAGILDYIAWGRGLGFKKFIFRSSSGIGDQYSKQTEFTAFNKMNHLAIDPLTEELQRLPGWKEIFSQHKSDSHVHVYKMDNEITVDIDESSEEEDPDDKVRRLTVMPNGVLYSSWIDPYSYLFSEDREQATASALQELPTLRPVRQPAIIQISKRKADHNLLVSS